MKTIKISAEDERHLRDGVASLENLAITIKEILRKLPGEPVEDLK